MENTSKIMLALVAGVAAGIAIGILIAPDKGAETRAQIGSTAKKLADTVLKRAENAVDEISKTVKS